MTMFYLISLVAAAIAICAVTTWSWWQPASIEPASIAPGPAAGTTQRPPADLPSSVEGMLVGQLVAGVIPREQYRRCIERIAARD
ncbi:MAG TPA: hypothetical protein VFO77_13425, partial [Actinoplanes sp.]|nr:hypothetical protein [Actinoplanes sp.]